MELFEIIIIAIGLSMDAFAVSIGKGLSVAKSKLSYYLKVGLWFGGFQALMPLIGYLLGTSFADAVAEFDHWIAFALLAIIGGNMIKEAVGNDDDEESNADFSIKALFVLAVATSIDALAAGVSFAFLKTDIISSIIIIGIRCFMWQSYIFFVFFYKSFWWIKNLPYICTTKNADNILQWFLKA